MRVDRLRNLAVIDPETACRVGIVTDYWIDAAAGRVAALAIRPVEFVLMSLRSYGRPAARTALPTRQPLTRSPTAFPRHGIPPAGWLRSARMYGLSLQSGVLALLGVTPRRALAGDGGVATESISPEGGRSAALYAKTCYEPCWQTMPYR
jgi:sporulation protein YlmC with PRC-barrel domain